MANGGYVAGLLARELRRPGRGQPARADAAGDTAARSRPTRRTAGAAAHAGRESARARARGARSSSCARRRPPRDRRARGRLPRDAHAPVPGLLRVRPEPRARRRSARVPRDGRRERRRRGALDSRTLRCATRAAASRPSSLWAALDCPSRVSAARVGGARARSSRWCSRSCASALRRRARAAARPRLVRVADRAGGKARNGWRGDLRRGGKPSSARARDLGVARLSRQSLHGAAARRACASLAFAREAGRVSADGGVAPLRTPPHAPRPASRSASQHVGSQLRCDSRTARRQPSSRSSWRVARCESGRTSPRSPFRRSRSWRARCSASARSRTSGLKNA